MGDGQIDGSGQIPIGDVETKKVTAGQVEGHSRVGKRGVVKGRHAASRGGDHRPKISQGASGGLPVIGGRGQQPQAGSQGQGHGPRQAQGGSGGLIDLLHGEAGRAQGRTTGVLHADFCGHGTRGNHGGHQAVAADRKRRRGGPEFHRSQAGQAASIESDGSPRATGDRGKRGEGGDGRGRGGQREIRGKIVHAGAGGEGSGSICVGLHKDAQGTAAESQPRKSQVGEDRNRGDGDVVQTTEADGLILRGDDVDVGEADVFHVGVLGLKLDGAGMLAVVGKGTGAFEGVFVNLDDL